MSLADLQTLVDGVAAELGAAAGLVDTEEHLLAHSAHDEVAIDEVRRAGIIHRRLDPEVRAWFEQWGYKEARGPVRTPADTTLGILERWCVPVQFHGTPLGYLWLIADRDIVEEELAPAVGAAQQIAALLFRRRLLSQVDTDLLRLLLIPNPESERAVTELRALGTYAHNGPVAVIVAGTADGDEPSSATLSTLAHAVHWAAGHALPGSVLSGVISDTAILVTPLRNQRDVVPAKTLAERVRTIAGHANHDLTLVAGIGGASELERASHSYAEARRALRMVRALPDLGPIAAWEDLGVFRALALVPPHEARNSVIDDRVRALLADEALAATAELFLDLAGDVQKTAAELFVHRTTLYQRLDRISQLYKLDLRRNGDHRLITHLGLKLARIAGF